MIEERNEPAPTVGATSELEAAPASLKPRVWTVLLVHLSLWIGIVAAAVALILVAVLQAGEPLTPVLVTSTATRLGTDSEMLKASVLVMVALELALVLVAAKLSTTPVTERLGLTGGVTTARLIVGTVTATIAMSASFAAAMALAAVEFEANQEIAEAVIKTDAPGFVAVLILLGLMAPLGEELLFRGYTQTRLTARWGPWPGIIVTATLFGLLHLDPKHSTFAFLLGLLLGWVTVKTGNIIAAICAHIANNLFMVVGAKFGLAAPNGLFYLIATVVLGVLAVVYIRNQCWRETHE